MNIVWRIIIDLGILMLLFVLPWWLMMVLITAAIFLSRNFFESLLFAALLDGFHGVPGIAFFGLNIFFVAFIGAIFVFSIYAKPRLRWYMGYN